MTSEPRRARASRAVLPGSGCRGGNGRKEKIPAYGLGGLPATRTCHGPPEQKMEPVPSAVRRACHPGPSSSISPPRTRTASPGQRTRTCSAPTSPKTWTSTAVSPRVEGGAELRSPRRTTTRSGSTRTSTPSAALLGVRPDSSSTRTERASGAACPPAREKSVPASSSPEWRETMHSSGVAADHAPSTGTSAASATARCAWRRGVRARHYCAGRTSRRVGRPSCFVRRKSSVRPGSETKSHISQSRL